MSLDTRSQSGEIAPARERVHVILSGSWDGLAELREALARHTAVDLAGWFEGAEDAAGTPGDGLPSVILHAARDSSLILSELAAIQKRTRAPVVLLVSDERSGLLEQALEADVADVLLLPQPPEKVVFALRKALRSRRRMIEEKRVPAGRVVTVFAPKGGTGKSVIATNLAVAFAAYENRHTLLIDLDLQFGDAAIMLGFEPEKTIYDLAAAQGQLDSEKLAGYTVRHHSGLHVLAAPLRPEDAELVTELNVARLLDVAKTSYDAIVIDTSPFFDEAVLAALDRTDELLLVCELDAPTVKNVRVVLQTIERLRFPPQHIRLVLNEPDPNRRTARSEIEEALGVEPSFEVPYDAGVATVVNRGAPLVLVGRGRFSEAIRHMSSALLQDAYSEPTFEANRRPGTPFGATIDRIGAAAAAHLEGVQRFRHRLGRPDFSLGLIVGSVPAAALLAVLAWQLTGSSVRPTAPSMPPSAATTERAKVEHVLAETRTQGAAAPPKAKRTTSTARLVLTAARGPCWLEVHVGSRAGKLLYRRTLAQGRSIRFTGQRLWLRLGWPPNLDAKVNGVPVRLPVRTSNVLVTAKGVRSVRSGKPRA